ncbi:MAG: response regulator transcription factor [Siphonobacter aquaeclarae]|nr:response regulator transcription factor [Siphonobacter aquaeclarae]
MDTRTILIVEDDAAIVELLSIHLKDLGCQVVTERNGPGGLARAQGTSFDLVILDVMLPGLSGLEVCRKIRQNDRRTPILMLTARSEEIDKVVGLETGADDYLTKPFSIRELIARVRAIFRRSEEAARYAERPAPLVQIGGLEIDIDKRRVVLNGERLDLSPREFELLALLASNPGKSYTRKQLLSQVWGYDFEGYEHTVNTHINRLRGKIEADASSPVFVLTTWGVGYRFNEDL